MEDEMGSDDVQQGDDFIPDTPSPKIENIVALSFKKGGT
jgi:hypothetical protein